MKRRRKIYIICLAMLAALFLGGLTASAQIEAVKVTGKYGQTEARSMLEMINDFRTGSDAWYYGENGQEVSLRGRLQPLVYDYQLEEAAMLRAMEIAVYYDHARPNMSGYASELVASGYGGWYAFAENIAAGYMDAADVFEGWQETNEDYEGQGHRRNMLSSDVTAVGIGHVYYNGYHYWVQLFRDLVGSTSPTPANDSETTVEIEVDSSVITNKSAEPSVNSIELPYGGFAELPGVTGGIQTVETWLGGICPVELSYEWTSADTGENYIKLDSGKGTIEAVGIGTTEITTTVMGTEITVPVTVVRIPIDSAENPAQVVLEQDSYTYSGENFEPVPTVTMNGTVLTAETDYTVTYENNTDAGTAVVTITGAGNYEGTITKEFEIAAKELDSESSVTVEQDALVYTGSEIKPEVTVVCGEKELDPGTDYEVEYSNNENAGQASVTITAKGNYKGELTGTFTILPLNLEGCTVDEIADQTYTGEEIRPSMTVKNGEFLLDESDYTVAYESNTDAGTASVRITGQKNCEGELTATFRIQPLNLENCTADEIADQTYTGEEIRPSVTVKNGEFLLDESDYTVEYESNTDVGTAAAKITGQKNCEGELTVTFRIQPLNLENCTADEIADQIYTGEEIRPSVTVKNGEFLIDESDYTVEYESNTDVGTAAAKITGRKNCEGELTVTFRIQPLNLEDCTVDEIADQTYTGEEIRPSVTVKNGEFLLDESDYTVEYESNTDIGTASVRITGQKNCEGELTATFRIQPLNLEDCTVDEIADQTYTGEEIRPSVTVKNGEFLVDESDYTVAYESNTDAGTAAVRITGQKNCEGELTVTFRIQPLNLENCTADEIADQTYTGEEIRPSVTVKNGEFLVDESDYTVEYESNTDAGTAAVKITGQKNCEGECTVAFQILPLDLGEGNCSIDEISPQEYTGTSVKPDVTVRHGEKILAENSDYSVKYSENKEPGTAVVTVTGKGNYTGTITQSFVIRKVPEETEKNPSGGETQKPEETEKNPSGGEAQKPGETEKNPSGGETQGPGETEKNPSGGETQEPGETEKNPSGGETQEPGETEKNPSGGETQEPEETEKNPSGGEMQKPGETEKNPSGGETQEPEETEKNPSGGEAQKPGETEKNPSGGETQKPEETEKNPSGGETQKPEETEKNPSGGETQKPEETEKNPSGGETQKPEETEKNPSGGETQKPGETEKNPSGGETQKPDETEKNPSGGETQKPEETEKNPSGGETQKPDETEKNPSGGETEKPPVKPEFVTGSRKEDLATGAIYTVTGSDLFGMPMVEYTMPVNKKRTTVNIPAVVVIENVKCKVTAIANNAFKNNKKLKQVIIGKNVSVIGSNAFRNCSKLSSVTMGKNIAVIKTGAFYNCVSLRETTLPAKVVTIGKQAFYGCKKLTRITIKTKKLTAKSVGNNAFGKIYAKAAVKVPKNKLKEYKKLLKGKGLGAKCRIS